MGQTVRGRIPVWMEEWQDDSQEPVRLHVGLRDGDTNWCRAGGWCWTGFWCRIGQTWTGLWEHEENRINEDTTSQAECTKFTGRNYVVKSRSKFLYHVIASVHIHMLSLTLCFFISWWVFYDVWLWPNGALLFFAATRQCGTPSPPFLL